MSTDAAPALKEHFGVDFVGAWADRLIGLGSEIDRSAFVRLTMQDYDRLTFTQRSWRMAENIRDAFAEDVPAVLEKLLATLPEESQSTEGVLNDGFWMWPISDYVRLFATGHFEQAMAACYELTKRFTAEFAIRPLLADDWERCIPYLQRWATDENGHVRRLVSEGTRARLPWATRLQLPRDEVIDLLSLLRADSSGYVRRSVANHLNDLAKDDTDRIFALLKIWHAEGHEETTWIARHALRNHFKSGDLRALALFGYETPKVELRDLQLEPAQVQLGDDLHITFDVSNSAESEQKLMIDLIFSFRKANGSLKPKVFKLKDTSLEADEILTCRKKFQMIQRTTRKLYPGLHKVAVQVNGVVFGEEAFELSVGHSVN